MQVNDKLCCVLTFEVIDQRKSESNIGFLLNFMTGRALTTVLQRKHKVRVDGGSKWRDKYVHKFHLCDVGAS